MSILIRGMEMPTGCAECPFEMYYFNTGETRCRATNKTLETSYRPTTYEERDLDCPLVPVPEHGRLIDADAFIKQKTEQICENCDRRRGMKDGKLTKRFVYAIGDAPCRACDTGDMLDYVDDAPTIIPASGGKENE